MFQFSCHPFSSATICSGQNGKECFLLFTHGHWKLERLPLSNISVQVLVQDGKSLPKWSTWKCSVLSRCIYILLKSVCTWHSARCIMQSCVSILAKNCNFRFWGSRRSYWPCGAWENNLDSKNVFLNKTWSFKTCSGLYFKGRLLTLPASIRLGWNTLTYCDIEFITVVKKFCDADYC